MSDHAAGDIVPEVDESRRKFLIAATVGTGAVGAVLTAVPFVASWNPSESARAAGLPTEVDLSRMEPGQMTTHFWRKKQIYVVKRTPEMLASLNGHDGQLKDAKSEESDQPAYAKNTSRAIKPEVLVLIGTCTHLGCLPKTRFTPGDTTISPDWPGGFFCPCHGSKFDLAGRVFQGSPASVNLRIPPYKFEGENKLIIGVDSAGKGVA
ncbi:MAG TPA: ubiquinol-cytochrome c reductase iron-sulfur subunit [Steroidobacteraceae bacterium]|nr:ubiquinol-cytochrome c reductase iron-sulfur subunit [Steroidobacteraceae bacterium]